MIVDGVELLRKIRDGELKENTKLIDDFGYEYFYEKDECEDLILYEFDNIVHKKTIPDYTMFQNNHFKILSEDEEIDIQALNDYGTNRKNGYTSFASSDSEKEKELRKYISNNCEDISTLIKAVK